MTRSRFIVDTNVGHLARKLRMLGYDALFINPIDDARLIRIAAEEGRVIVSSDRGIFERRPLKSGRVKGVYVDVRQKPLGQLKEILKSFGDGESRPFVRCIRCNTLLIPKSHEEARGRIPPRVYESVREYDYCPRCDQFFWQGDHVKRMREVIEKL
ncbi:MAG TPA: Mut7-C RNAse domain-containing protein [Nitrospiria bacterium]|nr:Mut7-C RNAse domain-containing protein [Nitrospiria bacterium]